LIDHAAEQNFDNRKLSARDMFTITTMAGGVTIGSGSRSMVGGGAT
jgi:hypothetical protein